MSNAAGTDLIVALVGPTASGKSALAMDLAQRFDMEIVTRTPSVSTGEWTSEPRSQRCPIVSQWLTI